MMDSNYAGMEDMLRRVAFEPGVLWRLLAVAGVVCLVYKTIHTFYDVYFGPLSKVPGPKLRAASNLPYAYNVWTGEEMNARIALHERYGPVVRVSPKDVSFNSGQAWKDIYGHRSGSKRSFPKDIDFYAKNVNGVWGIVGAPRDEDHARQRRILSHSFSFKSLKEQEPLFKEWAQLLVRKLRELQGEPVNAVSYYNFTTFDIMADLTFGESLNMLKGSEYVPWVSIIFASLITATRLALMKTLPVVWIIPRILGNLIRGKQVEHFNYAAVRVDKRLANPPSKPNLWTEVIRRGGKDNGMGLAEMHANSAIFMVAGSETTATWLSGLTYLLLRNPDMMDRLVTEIRTAFTCEEDITLEALASLTYLNACMEEALRVYPPVPAGLPRKIPEGGDFVDGHWLPQGTIVYVTQLAAYHSKDQWYEPDSFLPERWLGQDERFAKDDHSSFQPFSTGPRNCIGRNLAYHEARILFCEVLWNFDLELMEESKHWTQQQRVFTLWEKGPLLVKYKAIVR